MEQAFTLINNYIPSENAVNTLRQTPLVLIVGITGSGRDTLINELVKTGEYYQLVTTTTRAPRTNNGVPEQHGVEYYFDTPEHAVENIKKGEYIEVSIVHGNINGLLVDELERAKQSGKIAITDIDDQGTYKYWSISPNVIPLFVVPPNFDEWLRRLKLRYQSTEEFEATWPTRRESAIRELESALNEPYYHYVINDDLDDAVRACAGIAHGHTDVTNHKNANARQIVVHLLESLRSAD